MDMLILASCFQFYLFPIFSSALQFLLTTVYISWSMSAWSNCVFSAVYVLAVETNEENTLAPVALADELDSE